MNQERNSNPTPVESVSSKGSKDSVKRGYFAFWRAVRKFIGEILDIRPETDKQACMDMIRMDIPFKGRTAWVLICSIMIASVGLNADSPAVVIGAMLISPLMGPILGIGMAIAINDIDTLNKSLVNFAVMVFLSVITAFLFFAIFPLKIESNELLSRTQPDIRDVLIAFFGGLALIIARTKKGTIASVIFGVAIATALMPPLCTAGFGLAIGNFDHFKGAMYLFTINSIYIALATYIVLKLLNFPMEKYANSLRRRRIAQAVSVTAFLIMIPAIWTFYKVFQRSLYLKQAEEFVDTVIANQELANGTFVPSLTHYDYVREGQSTIFLVFLGEEVVSPEMEATWLNLMGDSRYSKLDNTRLDITQGNRSDAVKAAEYVQKLYEEMEAKALNKDAQLKALEAELRKVKSNGFLEIPYPEILAEATPLFPDLRNLGFANKVNSNFTSMDTSLIFTTRWKDSMSEDAILRENARLSAWLEAKLKQDSILVYTDR